MRTRRRARGRPQRAPEAAQRVMQPLFEVVVEDSTAEAGERQQTLDIKMSRRCPHCELRSTALAALRSLAYLELGPKRRRADPLRWLGLVEKRNRFAKPQQQHSGFQVGQRAAVAQDWEGWL